MVKSAKFGARFAGVSELGGLGDSKILELWNLSFIIALLVICHGKASNSANDRTVFTALSPRLVMV